MNWAMQCVITLGLQAVFDSHGKDLAQQKRCGGHGGQCMHHHSQRGCALLLRLLCNSTAMSQYRKALKHVLVYVMEMPATDCEFSLCRHIESHREGKHARRQSESVPAASGGVCLCALSSAGLMYNASLMRPADQHY